MKKKIEIITYLKEIRDFEGLLFEEKDKEMIKHFFYKFLAKKNRLCRVGSTKSDWHFLKKEIISLPFVEQVEFNVFRFPQKQTIFFGFTEIDNKFSPNTRRYIIVEL